MICTTLKCEFASNPACVVARHPRLSWIAEDGRRGQAQAAFQILAATAPARLTPESADLWDTGQVHSPHGMAGYAGIPHSARVWWTVRVWDADGQPGPFAPPAWFENTTPPALDGPPIAPAAHFQCSDERINRIHREGLESLSSPAGGLPTDGVANFAPTFAPLLYHYDATQAVARWIDRAAPGLDALAAAWQLFILRGDAQPLARHYAAFKAWVDALAQPSAGSLASPRSAASYYYAVLLLYEFAGVIGRGADKEHYAALFDQIAAEFAARFADNDIDPDTNAFALYLDMLPPERKPGAVEHLVRASSTAPTSPYLLEALTAAGRADLAYALVTRAGRPATAGDALWISQTIGGIAADADPDYPAFQRFSICPYPAPGLAGASLRLETVRGAVECAWQRDGGTFSLSATVPVGSTAVIRLPRPARSLAEGGAPFWQNGELRFLPEGVQEVSANNNSLTVTTGSGQYRFELRE